MATIVESPSTQQTPAPTPVTAAPGRKGPSPRALLIAVGVIAAIALGAWMVTSSSSRKEEFAARSLMQARSAALNGNLPMASSELQKLIDTYRGTDAAREAVISLNQIRMINGQSELAAVNLREFLGTNPPARFAAPAEGLLAAALENAGKHAEAADAFRRAAAAATVGYLKAEYLVDAGRAYRNAGKTAEAQAAYREVIEKYDATTSVTEARVRLAELAGGKL
jgi:outer membrane protein assembly factor BamD (BamD/ComL family)